MAFGWGVALLIILIWAAYFIWTVGINRSLRLLSFVPILGVVDIISIYFIYVLKRSIVVGGWLNGISWAFLPFGTLLFALYYPKPHPMTKRSWLIPVLALPSLITLFLTDPRACLDLSKRPYLPLLIFWMTPYFLAAYILLLRSWRQMRLPIMRHQVFYLTVGLIMITGNHLIIDIIMPYFGYNELWRNNFIVIILTCLLVAWGFLRHDIFRWRIHSENRTVDRQIESMTDGARVLAHIMKNHLTVIDYLTSQAEQGKIEKIQEIRYTCQNICQRLNEVGQMPPVDNRQDEIFSGEGLLELDCAIELPENQSVINDFHQPLPRIRGSKEQLRLAFHHLILNASESMKSGGEIRIEAQQEGDYLVVRISDQGVGITKERMEKIFRPFNTSKSLYESWGLGLSFVHQVFAAHQGGLIVESTPGKGSAFIVFIPALTRARGNAHLRGWLVNNDKKGRLNHA